MKAKHSNIYIAALAGLTLALAGCGAGGGAAPTTTAPGASAATANLTGVITDAVTGSGVPAVQVRAGGVSANTDAAGVFTLNGVNAASSVAVTFNAAGYVPQARTTTALTSAGSTVLINVPMLAVASTQTFNPAAAQNLAVSGTPATVTLAAGALQTATGALATGTVTAQMTPIAPASNTDVMPGNYIGVSVSSVAAAPIESFGAFDVRFTDASGAALNLAAGQTSTVRIPVSSRSATLAPTIPLFFFDISTGQWQQEGTATLAGTAPNQYYQGSVTHFTTWNADQVINTVTYTGCVQDVAGALVAGATVTSEGVDYTGKASTITDANGNFTVSMKSGATAIIAAVKDTRISNAIRTVQSVNSTTTTCLVLAKAAVAIKLTWGAAPTDLDSHTLGPNSTDHVSYMNQGSLTASPFLALDVDDTTSYGPEITTFSRLAQSRTYRFYVHNFSGTYTPGQTGSPAKVELSIAGSPRIFTPPVGETSATAYWHVFDLTTDTNCNITVTPAQVFLTAAPANTNAATAATFCP